MKQLKAPTKSAPETIGVSFRLPADMHAAFARLIDKAGITWSEAVRQLVQEYVEKFGS